MSTEYQSIKISRTVYKEAKKRIEELEIKVIDYIDRLVITDLERDNFLKMAFPNLKLEFISEDAVYLRDVRSNRSATIQIKEYEDSDLENSGFYVYCETCKKDNCVHVRYCLASDSIVQIYRGGKRVSVQSK